MTSCLMIASVLLASLPVAKAPLERTGLVRQPVVMEVAPFSYKTNFWDGVRFVSGKRSLLICGNDKDIDCNNAIQFGRVHLLEGRDLQASIWLKANGLWNGKPDPSDKLILDKPHNRATWSRDYKLPDGTSATFSYTLTGRKDGTVLVEVDAGCTQEQAEAQAKKIEIDAMLQLCDKITVGHSFGFGDVPHVFEDNDEMVAQGRTQKNKDIAGGGESSFFWYERNDPARTWTIDFPKNWMKGSSNIDYLLKERNGKPTRGCVYIFDIGNFTQKNLRGRTVRSSFVIDLGKSSVPKIKPTPTVGGIDFWGINALHVPVPPTRNLLMNGSFEQDFKGWTWEDWGAEYTEPKDGKYREEIEPCGKFGRHALVLRTASQPKASAIISAPIAVNAGKPHVLSFWAKVETLARDVYLNARPCSVSRTAKYFDQKSPNAFKATKLNVDGDWHRYEVPFTPDGGGIYARFGAPGNAVVMIDGVQIEEDEKATDFAEAPFVANLLTSKPLNDLAPGDPIDAKLDIQAQPRAKGKVRVRITNFYGEPKFDETFTLKGGDQVVPLNLDPKTLGRGLFIVRLDYQLNPNTQTPKHPNTVLSYTDYARFSIIAPLANKHATAQLYAGHAWYSNFSRGDIGVRKAVEWGWGSTDGRRNHETVTHAIVPTLQKYGVRNYVHIVAYEGAVMREVAKSMPQPIAVPNSFYEWTEATPERLALIEATAYRLAKECNAHDDIWSFWNEEESWAREVGFETHWKFNEAVQKGVKRAFSERGLKPRFTESHGTSHYFNGRNYDAIEGYLKTANEHGFKYDVIDIHPYQNIDGGILGGKDSDLETAHLIQQMKEAGYPDSTPIMFTECFNMSPFLIPQWGADGWNDSYRKNTQPSLDLGWREFVQAGSMARFYIIALKYWPKVQLVHTWTPRPFYDQRFTPLGFALAPNILGHLLDNPTFVGDAQPYGDVRGYCFRNRGKAVMPIWTTNHDVEYGTKPSPVISMELPSDTKFVDFEGNIRSPSTTPKPSNTQTPKHLIRVPLTPVPLFLVSNDAEGLLKGLREAVAEDPSTAFSVDVRPDLKGAVNLVLQNETKARQKGELTVGEQKVSYDIAPRAKGTYKVGSIDVEPMKAHAWTSSISLQPQPWNTMFFYVPKCGDKPDWSKIPGQPLRTVKASVTKGYAAETKMAWNKQGLFIRVDVTDPSFTPYQADGRKFDPKALYQHDGCLEVYFDAFGDARGQGTKGYDLNDSRYDFLGENVHRLVSVNWQLAQGTKSATDEEIAEKLQRKFTRTEKGFVYELFFAARYLAPIDLKPGTVAGVGLCLHDYDFSKDPKKPGYGNLSNSTSPGTDLDKKPYLFPIMILKD